ncbi:MAG TPA: hypothetical protein PLO56_08155 [Rhodothermales bacterium]|nr:hypothetical protein [Rhodothermales bacterium]
MLITYPFPSVYETHNGDLVNVASDLLQGMKIYSDQTGYIIGQLALSEGINPHKAINSSPHELDYRLLVQSGLLLASSLSDEPIVLTSGFPFSTYNMNRQAAIDFITGTHRIEYAPSTFGGSTRQFRSVAVAKTEIIPEIYGCVKAARNSDEFRDKPFFMVSLGYGTFEACLSNKSGIVQRTMISAQGIRYAVDDCMKELSKSYYLGLRTEHQFDVAFQSGSTMLNRKRIDITEIRKLVLKRYFRNVIASAIRNLWTDEDYGKADTLVIAGGGALYSDLMDSFDEEYGDTLNIRILDDPLTAASRGYCIHSVEVTGDQNSVAVGLDIGNANTVVTIYSDFAP